MPGGRFCHTAVVGLERRCAADDVGGDGGDGGCCWAAAARAATLRRDTAEGMSGLEAVTGSADSNSDQSVIDMTDMGLLSSRALAGAPAPAVWVACARRADPEPS